MSSLFKCVKAGVLLQPDDREVLCMVLREMGAKVKIVPSASKLPRGLTHLLADANLMTPELAVAAEASAIPVATASWVHQSMAEGKILPLSAFALDLAALKSTRAEARALSTASESAANASTAPLTSVGRKQHIGSPDLLHKKLSCIPDGENALFHSSQRDHDLTPSRTYAGRRRRGGPLKPTLSRGLKARRTKSDAVSIVSPIEVDTPVTGAGQLDDLSPKAAAGAHRAPRRAKSAAAATAAAVDEACDKQTIATKSVKTSASSKPAASSSPEHPPEPSRHAAPAPDKETTHLHLLVSGCDEETRQMAHVLVDSASCAGLPVLPPVGPAASLNEQHDAPVTHVITDRPSKRTQKLLRALACGAWVLKPSWVMESLTGGASDAPSKASGSMPVAAATRGIAWADERPHRWEAKSCPAARRHVGPSMFRGFLFLVAGLNTRSKRKPDPSGAEVSDILMRAGAHSVDLLTGSKLHLGARPAGGRLVVLQGGRGLTAKLRQVCTEACASQTQAPVPVLPLEWAWDCLWNGKMLSVEDACIEHLAVPPAAGTAAAGGGDCPGPALPTKPQKAKGKQAPKSTGIAEAKTGPAPRGRVKRRRNSGADPTDSAAVAAHSASPVAASPKKEAVSLAKRSRVDRRRGSMSADESETPRSAPPSGQQGPTEANTSSGLRSAGASQTSEGSDDGPVVAPRRSVKRGRAPGINAAVSAASRHAKRSRSLAHEVDSPGSASQSEQPKVEEAQQVQQPNYAPASALPAPQAAGRSPAKSTSAPAVRQGASPLNLQRVSASHAMLPHAAAAANTSVSTLSASDTPGQASKTSVDSRTRGGVLASPPPPPHGISGEDTSQERKAITLSDDIEDSQGAPAASRALPSQHLERHKPAATAQPRPTQINFQQHSLHGKANAPVAGASAGTYSCDTEHNTLSEGSGGGGSLPLGAQARGASTLPLAAAAPPVSRGLSQAESATISKSSVSTEGMHAPVSTPVASRRVSRGGTGRASVSAHTAPAWSPASSIPADASPGHESVMSGVAFSLTGKEADSARKRSAIKAPAAGSSSKVSPPGTVNHAHGATAEKTVPASSSKSLSSGGAAASPESVSKTLTFIAAPVAPADSQISEPEGEAFAQTGALAAPPVPAPARAAMEDSLSEGSQEW